MSWDIYAMRLPPEVTAVADIPHDYEPPPIGSREEVIAAILRVVPQAISRDKAFLTPEMIARIRAEARRPTRADPAALTVDGDGYAIEFNLGFEDPLTSFSMSVWGGGDEAVQTVLAVLQALHVSGLDSGSGGILAPETARESFRNWQAYRDQVARPIPSSG